MRLMQIDPSLRDRIAADRAATFARLFGALVTWPARAIVNLAARARSTGAAGARRAA